MAMSRIKVGDKIKVVSGSHKGKLADVTAIKGDKVYLSGIGDRKRHQAANRVAPAGKRDIQLPIHISNIALVVDAKANTTSTIGYQIKQNGTKVRIAKQAKNKEIK